MRLLIVDDEKLRSRRISKMLSINGPVEVAASQGEALQILEASPEWFDIVLVHRTVGDDCGLELIKRVKQYHALTVGILYGEGITLDLAVQAANSQVYLIRNPKDGWSFHEGVIHAFEQRQLYGKVLLATLAETFKIFRVKA